MGSFLTSAAVAESADLFGVMLFVAFGFLSYLFDAMRKQKKEAEARQKMQEEFKRSALRPSHSPDRPKSGAVGRTPAAPPVRRQVSRPAPRVRQEYAPPAGDEPPVLENALSDAEAEAHSRMQERARAYFDFSAKGGEASAEKDAFGALYSGRELQAAPSSVPEPGEERRTPSRVAWDAAALRQAVICKEVLDRPRALRGYSWR
ncbi:MAG: hypothetical protein LIO63_03190 [Akkermansia sp.]|nr:hypothetical protein [Akkermansia sp.]